MMYKKKKLRAYILATLAWFAIAAPPAYTNITKTQVPALRAIFRWKCPYTSCGMGILARSRFKAGVSN